MEVIKKPERRISVRNLVEFILREGDIREGALLRADVDAMQAGAKMHRKLQNRGGNRYAAEVSLSVTMDVECAMLTVEGRADGVIDYLPEVNGMKKWVEEEFRKHQDEKVPLVTIDEIKCMYRNVYDISEPEAVHIAQAKCYAYMYARDNGLSDMLVQITYVNLENEALKRFWYKYSFEELETWFFKLVWDYTRFLEFEINHHEALVKTANEAVFPFTYRNGQKEMAANVYSAMKRGERLFCQAPTGVGKTISTVFPAVKAVGEGVADKIFYLTAKTITRTVAEESFSLLREQGLKLSSVTISARDKLCILDERNCNPAFCERAKGHFDRINDCLYELLTNEESITRECIEEYSQSYMVCPYELALDVSLWVDSVICDYNYLFDPKVQLKRFFSEGGLKEKYLFLVDEAHNLVDRGRNMYSAELKKRDIMAVRRILKPVSKGAEKALSHLNRDMLSLNRRINEEIIENRGYERYITLDNCDTVMIHLMQFVAEMEKLIEERAEYSGLNEAMDFYFQAHHFINMYSLVNEKYVIYAEAYGKNDLMLKLFCVNPSDCLSNVLNKGKSTIFFSATLLPVNYYKELLTGDKHERAVYIPSPFHTENRFLAITSGVTSKYSSRGQEQYLRIVDYLKLGTVKQGNYMVFFSSYKMMEEVYDIALEQGLSEGRRLLIQESNMSEKEREEFLREFQKREDTPLIAFCILGGIFSEGIDLRDEQLIGAFVVGNGLPQVCVERKLIQNVFTNQGMDGFAYSYIYPGMNKVLQAAGRVIRTENDRGVILLMDDRFNYREYRALFPQEWSDVKRVTLNNIEACIKDFWGL